MTTRTNSSRKATADLTTELAALKDMTVGQLHAVYTKLFEQPSRSRNRGYLRKKLAWRIQELAEGGLSARARKKLAILAQTAPARRQPKRVAAKWAPVAGKGRNKGKTRDPRLPAPGSMLSRAHGGKDHKVKVLADGFEYKATRYPSLSKVAREITGTVWNGYLFFGLQARA